MATYFTNARVLTPNGFEKTSVCIDGGNIAVVGKTAAVGKAAANSEIVDCYNCYIFPGFADVHVHLREPGFSYKETIRTGTMAAAHGGYTAVCAMPNLSPVPDCAEHMKIQTDLIMRDAVVKVQPYAAITTGESGERLSDMMQLMKYTGIFSDDGRGVQSESMMRSAMEKVSSCGAMIVAHCEDNSLLNGGYIRDGEYAHRNGHVGINPESEWRQLKRDLRLAAETNCKYHVCHISTRQSVELIRLAKREGINVTAETAPHYLLLTENDLQEDGRFKMNPPIGNAADRDALREGICDGTIDIIATDHAPHSIDEKSKGLRGSLMGITGLETAFSVLYTDLVLGGVITLEALVKLLTLNPRKRFGLGGGVIEKGGAADLTIFDTAKKFKINSKDFVSMGKSTPFDAKECFGRCMMTVYNGETVYKKEGFGNEAG